jgi:adenosylcobyric acid synthase
MAKALMIQGTGSGTGKSMIVTGLCRILRDLGIKVAPFKAQNMALNSFITREGGEIGRAQVLQAEAAGIEPCNDINPVLLKAMSNGGCQVIINGKVYAHMKARDYYSIKDVVWREITTAYDRLSERYDLIVIEGAGSPAEINLREEEVVNMRMARYAKAPVILVGDIDRGGVFASLYGTVELLKDSPGGESDADYIRGFIINKFRGDIDILRPGLRMIEERTGRPVIGVIDYLPNLMLDEEDGLSLERIEQFKRVEQNEQINVVVLRLKYISNFTDFAPFFYEPDVDLKYSLRAEDLNSADLIIIPGSKNTVSDLLLLRSSGLEECIKMAVKKGTSLIGICGGYQMLGKKILDPFGVESEIREVEGMGLLDTVTTLGRTKITCQITAKLRMEDGEEELKGYEIHMGNTTGDVGLFEIKRYLNTEHRTQNTDNKEWTDQNSPGSGFCAQSSEVLDGSMKGNVWGTYIHGIFDNDAFRRRLLNRLRGRKGLSPLHRTIDYHAVKEEAINRWAGILRESVDICFILRLLGMEYCKDRLMGAKGW